MNVLKYLRTESDFTHRHLATLSGLTSSEISLIESGRLKPSQGQLERLAKALHVSRPAALIEKVQLIDQQRAVVEQVPA